MRNCKKCFHADDVEKKEPFCNKLKMVSTSDLVTCSEFTEVCVVCDRCHKHPKNLTPVGEGALFCSECEKNMIPQNYEE